MSLFEPKLMGVSRKKFSNASENDSFAASFTPLKLGKDRKEDDSGWEKARRALNYRLVNMSTCSPEGRCALEGYHSWHFLGAQEQWARLAQKLSLKKR